MISKRVFKGKISVCPSCKAGLKTSWLSRMSLSSFMYSKDCDAIYVGEEVKDNKFQHFGFNFNNPLRCPICGFKLSNRSSDPSWDRAVFFEGMIYISNSNSEEIEVEVI